MKGEIVLEGMEFHAFHGVYPEERLNGQLFRVDFSGVVEISKAAASDSINDATDYTLIYALIAEEMKVASNLLEHVLARIDNRLKAIFPEITQTELKITKLSPPVGGSMHGVSLILRS